MLTVADGGGGGQVLSLETDQVRLIVSALREAALQLEASRDALGAVDASAFGGSSMGSFVREHSEKAYLAVSEALADNAKALQRYESALVQVGKDTQEANDASTQASTTHLERVATINQNLQLGGSCTAAGAGDPTATCS